MSIDDGSLTSADLLSRHASAQLLIDGALRRLQPGELARPTPCGSWNLGDLLSHVLGQNRGLASACRGRGRELNEWRPVDLGTPPGGPSPEAALLESVAQLVSALAERGLEGALWMPEISPATAIPVRVAVLAHLVDTVVHGWDVAATRGLPYEVPDDVLGVAARVAAAVPDGPGRGPGAAFGPALRVPARGPLELLLVHLGRDPRWSGSPVAEVSRSTAGRTQG